MNLHFVAQACGLIGDALNLCGAIVLARDMLGREEEVKKHEAWLHALQEAKKRGVPIKREEHPLEEPEDIVLALAKSTVSLGRRGIRFLVAGFAFLIAYRILELLPRH